MGNKSLRCGIYVFINSILFCAQHTIGIPSIIRQNIELKCWKLCWKQPRDDICGCGSIQLRNISSIAIFFLAFKPQGPINEWILNLHTVGGTGRSVPDSNSQNIHASRIFVFILLRINSNDLNNSKQHLRSPRNRTNDGGLCYANTGGISLTADMAINNDHAESTQLSYR